MIDKNLKKAIGIVEDAGGIVMLQETEEEQALIARESDIIDQAVEEDFYVKEYQERKDQAFKEFDDLLGSKNFSVNAVDDICHENGIEMDDIEKYIHGHY